MRIEGKLAEIAGIDASGVRLEVAQTRSSVIDAAETVIRKDPSEEGLVRVSYLTHDQDGGDYWNDADGRGSLQLFRTQSDRDDYVVLEKARGEIPLIVDQYDHGGSHFSIQNSRFYPDRRWDVAPRGVYVPCREVQDRYRGEVGEATRLTQVRQGTPAASDQLAVQESLVELHVLDQDRVPADEGKDRRRHIRKARLTLQGLFAQTMDLVRREMHRPHRIQKFVEDAAGRPSVHHLDHADLDDPVAVPGAGAAGLGIQEDLAHPCSSSSIIA